MGSGVHYLHGNLYHKEKKKDLIQCGKQAQICNTEELQHTQMPTKLDNILVVNEQTSLGYLLGVCPLTLISHLQQHPLAQDVYSHVRFIYSPICISLLNIK